MKRHLVLAVVVFLLAYGTSFAQWKKVKGDKTTIESKENVSIYEGAILIGTNPDVQDFSWLRFNDALESPMLDLTVYPTNSTFTADGLMRFDIGEAVFDIFGTGPGSHISMQTANGLNWANLSRSSVFNIGPGLVANSTALKLYSGTGSSYYPAYIQITGANGEGRMDFLMGNAADVGAESMSPRMSLTQDGLLGIGTTDPGTRLHVVGDGINNKVVRVDNGGVAIRGGNTTINSLRFDDINGEDRHVLYVDENNDVLFGNANLGDVRILGAGTNLVIPEGFVGIGTDDPQYALDVNGVINATAINVDGAPSGNWGTSGTDINFLTGNVGIGLASPTERLHVRGKTLVESSQPALLLKETDGNADENWRLDIKDGGFRVLPMTDAGALGAKAFSIEQSGDAYFSGNVGIGTSNAQHKLDVAGTVNATDFLRNGIPMYGQGDNMVIGEIDNPEGSLNILSNGGYEIKFSGTAESANIYAEESMFLLAQGQLNFGSSGTNNQMVLKDGNLGLGTDNPQGSLDIQSTNGYEIRFSDPNESANIYSEEALYLLAQDRLSFGSSGVNDEMVLNSGKLGIGTADPQSKLDVNGVINASGYTLDGVDLRAALDLTSVLGATMGPATGSLQVTNSAGNTPEHLIEATFPFGEGYNIATRLSMDAGSLQLSAVDEDNGNNWGTSLNMYNSSGVGGIFLQDSQKNGDRSSVTITNAGVWIGDSDANASGGTVEAQFSANADVTISGKASDDTRTGLTIDNMGDFATLETDDPQSDADNRIRIQQSGVPGNLIELAATEAGDEQYSNYIRYETETGWVINQNDAVSDPRALVSKAYVDAQDNALITSESGGDGITFANNAFSLGGTAESDVSIERGTNLFQITTINDGRTRFIPELRMKEIGAQAPLMLMLRDSEAPSLRIAFNKLTDGGVESGVTGDGMQARMVVADLGLRNVASVIARSGTEANAGGDVIIGDPFGGWNFRGMYYNVNTTNRNAGPGENLRWIPDKQYSDSFFAGHPLNAVALSPSANEDGNVLAWDATNAEYRLLEYSGTSIISEATPGNVQYAVNATESGISIDKTDGDVSQLLVVNEQGFVGIGTSDPSTNLTVNGKILAEEVRVVTSVESVPDYVFSDEYELQPLEEVEAYVKEHSHLPEVPSAEEIARDGQDVAAMNLILLKKIEELTLHVIELQKENQKQSELNQKQNEVIERLLKEQEAEK